MSAQKLKQTYGVGSLSSRLLTRLSETIPSTIIGPGGPTGQYPFERDWRTWLPAMLPRFCSDDVTGELVPFGEHHVQFWDWVWALRLGTMPPPMVAIWPRGGGKSTSAELAGAMVGALKTRRYVLYICETQTRAQDHVDTVRGMFESRTMERYYPHVADRLMSKYGSSKGWRRDRLRTSSGFTVDAIGLDVAARGAKIDDVRPDLMIFDDVDSEDDSPAAVEKKIRTITRKFLPAGSPDLAVLMVQNLIHPNSIFSQLAGRTENEPDFLVDRIVSGPFPAVEDLVYEKKREPDPETGAMRTRYYVTGGRAIWEGMNLKKCQEYMNSRGEKSFLTESQQEVDDADGGMFSHLDYPHCAPDEVPELLQTVCWVDPAVTDKDTSDSCGLIVDGIDMQGTIYRLWSWERRAAADYVLTLALAKALEYGCRYVGVETNNGGDLWKTTYKTIVEKLRKGELTLDGVPVRLRPAVPPVPGLPGIPGVRAGRLPVAGKPAQKPPGFRGEKATGAHGSKVERAGRMLVYYEHGKFVHVTGTHNVLEKALRRFPRVKPFDLVDAAHWSYHDLSGKGRPGKWAV